MDRAQLLAMLLDLSFDGDQLLLERGDQAELLDFADGTAVFPAALGAFLTGYLLARQELVESEDELAFLLALERAGPLRLDD